MSAGPCGANHESVNGVVALRGVAVKRGCMKALNKSALFAALVFAGLVFSSCSSGYGALSQAATTSQAGSGTIRPPAKATQISEGGSVTISVQWAKAENGQLTFEVSMNTHSVNLEAYDFRQLAALRDDGGKEFAPTSWAAPGGGHHRSGTLTFPVPPSVEQGQTKYLEMTIRGVAGVPERVLRWEL